MIKTNKRGFTKVVSTLLLSLITLVLIAVISIFIINMAKNSKEDIEILQKLGLENARIERAVGDFKNGGQINLTIKRAFSAADKSISEYEKTITEQVPVDVVLVLDRSGSMRQSGWVLETLVSPVNTATLIVPRNAYSTTYTFNVPYGTTRLAVAINWSQIPGLNGSEASEFAMNLRKPSGTWIANNGNRPDALSNIVDPPNSVGTALEYFSGISTKPQVFYIENPQSGNWAVKVYGWNLRPKTTPPTTQNVSVNVYLGDAYTLNKSSTVLSSDTVRNASKNFVNRLEEKDRVSVIAFGSYAEILQGLTQNKLLVNSAIDNLGNEGGTYINMGIDMANQHLLEQGNESALKIITILTDGQNDIGPQSVINSAQQAKNNNFTIFTIGLTNFVDEQLLEEIATEPEYYYYSEFNMLDKVYNQVSEKIISIQKTSTVGISFILVFWGDESICQKEITSESLPEIGSSKTIALNLGGCTTNITKIEIYPKIKNKIGPLIDVIKVKP